MTNIWLGGYVGYNWTLAFSTEDRAHGWLLGADTSGTRQITRLEVDSAAHDQEGRDA